MVNTKVTEMDIRRFIMDTPEHNTLIDGVKFSSEAIDQAIYDVIDYFNVIPPAAYGRYTCESFPYRALLIMGVSGWLLRGAAVSEAINNLSYSANSVAINDRDKAEIFTKLGSELWGQFLEAAKGIKVSQNVAALLGSHNSEYARYQW